MMRGCRPTPGWRPTRREVELGGSSFAVASAPIRFPRSSARRKIVRGWPCEVEAAPPGAETPGLGLPHFGQRRDAHVAIERVAVDEGVRSLLVGGCWDTRGLLQIDREAGRPFGRIDRAVVEVSLQLFRVPNFVEVGPVVEKE
jgi:hypothetical protein